MIRPAQASEFGAIGRIFHDSVHRIAKRDYTDEQLRAWSAEELSAEHWHKRTAGLEVRVAVVENLLAGFIGFSLSGYIDLLFTRPEFVRRGVARALLLDAESLLGQSGVETAWTEASLTARGFFETMGYSIVREQTMRRGEVELRNFRMEKALI
jgi:putative acetyltransferase